MPGFPESDWKVFRDLRLVALDRFCERVLAEVAHIAVEPGKTNHERYLAIYRILRERDKDLARLFNDARRSTAFMQLLGIQSEDLLTAAEMSRFSEETRRSLDNIVRDRD